MIGSHRVVGAWPAGALFALTAGWMALLVAVPAVRAMDAGGGARVAAALFHVGCSRICHQRPERSLRVAGQPMPVCARCTGLYAGALAGAGLAWVRRRRGPTTGDVDRARRWRWLLVAAGVPTAASWGLEAASLVGTGQAARFLLALPLGASAAWVVSRALAAEWGARAPALH